MSVIHAEDYFDHVDALARHHGLDQRGLPKVITFIQSGTGFASNRFFYHVIGKRAPRRGEWYLSGAIIEAYQAPNDLTDEYTIVERGARARQVIIEVPA